MKKILLLLPLIFLAGCAVNFGGETNDISSAKLAEKFNASNLKSKYQLEGATLKMNAKDNPKDMVRVVIGDKPTGLGAETDFVPNVEISRWDEVSFKLKPKGLDEIAKKDKKLKLEDGKVKFETPKKDFILYDLPVSEENPEGGFEYQIDLKEKPATNKIEFALDTKGLDFFYQPALNVKMASSTCSETDCGGSHRPENVVGSYAVYASEQKINYVGGKEYKTGKVGHIYRPKISDSVGNETWGELSITGDTLKVNIPQEFLDKAVYPVRHAAGLTFGYITMGSSSDGWDNNIAVGMTGTSGVSGNVINIIAGVRSTDGTPVHLKGLVVNTTNPYTIVSNSVGDITTITSSISTWATSTFSGIKPSILENTNYFAAFVMDSSKLVIYKDTGTGGKYDDANNYTTPKTWYYPYSADAKYSIYATYTAGGGASTCTPPASGNWTVNLGDNCYVTTDKYINGNLILIDNTGSGCLNIIDGATLAVKQWEATTTRDYICLESDDNSKLKTWTPQ
jgi:hypothetical protein